jgi:hypothetical protein
MYDPDIKRSLEHDRAKLDDKLARWVREALDEAPKDGGYAKIGNQSIVVTCTECGTPRPKYVESCWSCGETEGSPRYDER